MPDQKLATQLHTLQQAYDRNDLPATGKQLTVLKVSKVVAETSYFANSLNQVALARAGLLFPSQENDKEDLAVARTFNRDLNQNIQSLTSSSFTVNLQDQSSKLAHSTLSPSRMSRRSSDMKPC
jgi:hypothetical protein